MMWREMTDRLIENDPELSAWRTALTVRYIVNSWNDAHDTPISEDAVLLFLCDEAKGELTEEQRVFAKMRREEIQSGIRRMICEWLLYDSMVPQGCAGDFRQFHRRLRPLRESVSRGPLSSRLCAPVSRCVPRLREGQSPCPSRRVSGQCGPVVGGVAVQGFRPFWSGTEGRKGKQEKALALFWRLGGHFRPQCGRFPGTGADAFPDRQTCD